MSLLITVPLKCDKVWVTEISTSLSHQIINQEAFHNVGQYYWESNTMCRVQDEISENTDLKHGDMLGLFFLFVR